MQQLSSSLSGRKSFIKIHLMVPTLPFNVDLKFTVFNVYFSYVDTNADSFHGKRSVAFVIVCRPTMKI